ncbi:MAG TPA: arsenic resistance N-acetyltransferase ArsN2 [Deltaproteobacteria bacterium]|nr:arsenic resistance N-acetyltransferase ArsN2 [Deltaproteobacteria bacterium]HPR54145.1 arsenic resistance N-acetyltransferase ArsN2 [Deltaproteobacteria bacterium]HXK47093.1 arsenic resistance N-acetyltransferase ArsN2 [Deltaproteobacteria bacterium]
MKKPSLAWEDIMKALEALYLEVDEAALRLQAVHAGRLHCTQGCSTCCVDGITVFEVEAGYIEHHAGGLIETAEPYPEGACAFLDGQGSCRIYQYRPYVCRTQGLPLRWMEETGDGVVVEMRDICPVNDAGPPVETLPEGHCWTVGPFETRLAALQALASGDAMVRIPLRSLLEGYEEITIEALSGGDEHAVLELLADAGLPTRDLSAEKIGAFLVARTGDGRIIAAVGCEAFGADGLLRSLVVHPDFRGLGLGKALAGAMEELAASRGVRALFLLTTTAPGFFPRLGYVSADRAAVPECIGATGEFRDVCPVSAVCMRKDLEPR